MGHILRLEDDRRLCDLPPGQDMLEIGFVKIERTGKTLGTDWTCIACSIVLNEANQALDTDFRLRQRGVAGKKGNTKMQFSRKKAGLFGLVIACVVGVLIAIGGTGSASAYPGCSSLVRGQWDPVWHYTVLWRHPVSFLEPQTTVVEDIELEAKVHYTYCPNGGSPNKMAPDILQYCWENPGDHKFFTGVTFNGHVVDDRGNVWNPGDIKVPDDGTSRNCKAQFNPQDDWSFFYDRPKYKVHATVNSDFATDSEWWMQKGSDEWNGIDYADAVGEGQWHARSVHGR